MSNMDYGREIITRSYFAGQVRKETREVEQSIRVTDKAALIREILSALELVNAGTTTKLTVEIYAEAGDARRIVKKYLA